MTRTSLLPLWSIALLLGITACQERQFPTMTLAESPSSFVRLERDPMAPSNGGHSHPISLTPEHMAAVLSGVMIEEPTRLFSFLEKSSEPRRHPAFNEADIRFFAPLLAKGLALATSEEVVTFYQSHQDTAIIRKVTSGGVFAEGDRLHIVLSNYRSPTHSASDPGVNDTMDDRLTPMRSIAPQETRLYYEPSDALVVPDVTVLSTLFSAERRELIVRYKNLAPAGAGARHEAEFTKSD